MVSIKGVGWGGGIAGGGHGTTLFFLGPDLRAGEGINEIAVQVIKVGSTFDFGVEARDQGGGAESIAGAPGRAEANHVAQGINPPGAVPRLLGHEAAELSFPAEGTGLSHELLGLLPRRLKVCAHAWAA